MRKSRIEVTNTKEKILTIINVNRPKIINTILQCVNSQFYYQKLIKDHFNTAFIIKYVRERLNNCHTTKFLVIKL